MLRVRDIMTTNVVTVPSSASVREAMEILAQHHVSGAPVVTGSELVGVVTATDLMAFAAALPGVPTELDTYDGWSEAGESTPNDRDDRENEPSGAFFSEMWDDAGADVTERMANPSTPEWNSLEEHDVSEAMTRTPLITLGPEAGAEVAADLMRRNGIHRLLVTEAGLLVGIVSSLDIAKAAADHRFTTRTYVFNRDAGIGAAR